MGKISRNAIIALVLLRLCLAPAVGTANGVVGDHEAPPEDSEREASVTEPARPIARPRTNRKGCDSREVLILERALDDRDFVIERIEKLKPAFSDLSTNQKYGINLSSALIAELARMKADQAETSKHPLSPSTMDRAACKSAVQTAARKEVMLESTNMMVWYAKFLIQENRKGTGSETERAMRAAKATLKRYRNGDKKGPWTERWAFGDKWLVGAAGYQGFSKLFMDLFPDGGEPEHEKLAAMMNNLSKYLITRSPAANRPRVASAAATEKTDEEKPEPPKTNPQRDDGDPPPAPPAQGTSSLRDEVKRLPPRTSRGN